jgi:hypothetical protein
MTGRPSGINLLAAALLAAGIAGIAAFWVMWPRTSNTSPLAALFALVWSCTYVATAILTWRRSHLAARAFPVAMGLLLLLVFSILPGGQVLVLLLFVVIFGFAYVGYRYLHKASKLAAS